MSKSPTQLSDLQLDVLRVLWDKGEATVNEVHAALAERRSLAATTVSTLLNRLEKYGRVHRTRVGRLFVYRATESEVDAKRSMVGELTRRLFSGDVPELLNHLLSAQEMQPGDLERIKKMIADQEQSQDEA